MEPAGSEGVPGSSAGIKDRKEHQAWYLKISKLALALAIIHSKPPEKSSKEYTEHLAKIISGQDFKWRSKVEALEAEVLRLRQELLLNKICPRFCLENRNPDAFTEILLDQEHINPIINCSSQLEDSGCDVSSDCVFDTVDISHNFGHSEHSCNTSSCTFNSEILPILNTHCTNKEKTLAAHMQFLQHLLELRKLTEAGGLKTVFTKLESDCSTISDSVSRLLDGLLTFYKNPKFPVSNFLTEAVSVLINLITDANLSNHVLKMCFEKLEEFKKNLVQIILSNSNINRFQVQYPVSHTLVLLGRCNILRKSIISLLLSEVNQFADELQQAHQIEAKYNVTQYENIFSLCMILEQLLQKGTGEGNISSSDYDGEEKNKFLQNLDQIILHLADEFPLFSVYMWRLGALLNSSQMQIV
ncbi:meiosis-specific protein MEI4 isoform X1 [Chrysemys picta bellii]|uniref:meiosis-specific protein MEI4 isoform X1 n=1 Tax=Chrysemys picta bellii TaxID=8478 RepID=UPI00046BFB10|nr:meiosis-specific protein MEI4 [Chrysemys picta bellii]